jgi:lysophospholipase L1-like esterase
MTHYFIRLVVAAFFACTQIACGDDARLPPLETDSTILAFGDSLTYGTGTSRNNAYPAVLEKLIDHRVINAGIPGEVSEKGLARLPGLIEKYHPGLIIICHGANDILRKLDREKTRNNIQQMITLARENDAEVVLIAVPEFSLFLTAAPMYQVLADKNQVPLASDILGDIIGNNSLKSDHVHPNARGYRRLAENIRSLLIDSGAIE